MSKPLRMEIETVRELRAEVDRLLQRCARLEGALAVEGHGQAGGFHRGDLTQAATCHGCVALRHSATAESEASDG